MLFFKQKELLVPFSTTSMAEVAKPVHSDAKNSSFLLLQNASTFSRQSKPIFCKRSRARKMMLRKDVFWQKFWTKFFTATTASVSVSIKSCLVKLATFKGRGGGQVVSVLALQKCGFKSQSCYCKIYLRKTGRYDI